MSIVIDELEIQIDRKSNNASQSLDSLANSFKNLNKVLSSHAGGVSAMEKFSKSMTELNKAIGSISATHVTRMTELANAMSKLATASTALKGVGNISKQVTSTAKAIDKVGGSAMSEGGSASATSGASDVDLSKISTGWKALGASVSKAVAKIKEGSTLLSKLTRSVGRVAFYRALRTVIKTVVDAFQEGLTSAYEFSKLYNGDLYNGMNKLASVTAQMKNQLGALYGEVLLAILPTVTNIVNAVIRGANVATEFAASLRGDSEYKRAKEVSIEWDEATNSIKKYRKQLLGLDELNVLTSESKTNGKGETKTEDLYEYVKVSQKVAKAAESTRNVIDEVKGKIQDLEEFIPGALIGIGAVLAFSGANIPLGLGMLAYGTYKGVTEIKAKWKSLTTPITEKVASIESIVGGGLIALGSILAFSGANIPLGIGLMLAGASGLGASAINAQWDGLSNEVQDKITRITTIVGGASLALGAILAFSGANIPLGIGMMLAGATGLGTAISLNWDGILSGLKKVWSDITVWWHNNVYNGWLQMVADLEKATGWDINGDGDTSGIAKTSTYHVSDSGVVHGGIGFTIDKTPSVSASSLLRSYYVGTSAIENFGNATGLDVSGTKVDITGQIKTAIKETLTTATGDDLYAVVSRKEEQRAKLGYGAVPVPLF